MVHVEKGEMSKGGATLDDVLAYSPMICIIRSFGEERILFSHARRNDSSLSLCCGLAARVGDEWIPIYQVTTSEPESSKFTNPIVGFYEWWDDEGHRIRNERKTQNAQAFKEIEDANKKRLFPKTSQELSDERIAAQKLIEEALYRDLTGHIRNFLTINLNWNDLQLQVRPEESIKIPNLMHNKILQYHHTQIERLKDQLKPHEENLNRDSARFSGLESHQRGILMNDVGLSADQITLYRQSP